MKLLLLLPLFSKNISHTRFTSVDPAREFHNTYSYVGNNPISNRDPQAEQKYDQLQHQSEVYADKLAENILKSKNIK